MRGRRCSEDLLEGLPAATFARSRGNGLEVRAHRIGADRRLRLTLAHDLAIHGTGAGASRALDLAGDDPAALVVRATVSVARRAGLAAALLLDRRVEVGAGVGLEAGVVLDDAFEEISTGRSRSPARTCCRTRTTRRATCSWPSCSRERAGAPHGCQRDRGESRGRGSRERGRAGNVRSIAGPGSGAARVNRGPVIRRGLARHRRHAAHPPTGGFATAWQMNRAADEAGAARSSAGEGREFVGVASRRRDRCPPAPMLERTSPRGDALQ